MARVAYAASVSPTGERAILNTICIGTGTYRTIYAAQSSATLSNNKVFVNSRQGDSTGWVGWQTLVSENALKDYLYVVQKELTVDSNAKTTLTVPSASTHLLVIPTTNTARVYIAYVIAPSSGTVYSKTILEQGVEVNTSTANKLILTWSGTPTAPTMYDFVLRGNVIT